jgi:hypothetical protein
MKQMDLIIEKDWFETTISVQGIGGNKKAATAAYCLLLRKEYFVGILQGKISEYDLADNLG